MLHVLVGAHCSNHCRFCMESDREARRRSVESKTPEDVRHFIESYPDRDEILFTSGEPTLNRELPGYIRFAREQGFRRIGIISNGRRMAQEKYLKTLLQLGVNKFTLSIHGHTAELHDALTQAKGAFRQTAKALANLKEARRRHRFELHTSTVVVRSNLRYVPEILALLDRHEVDRMCFNVMMVRGYGEERFQELMPRYSEVIEVFQELVSGLTERQRLRTAVADVPPCVGESLPEGLWGEQEVFQHFEERGSSGIIGMSLGQIEDLVENGDDRVVGMDALLARAHGGGLPGRDGGEGRFYLTSRTLKENDILRSKRDLCSVCQYEGSCPGVWRGYVEAYGWGEFWPVGAPGWLGRTWHRARWRASRTLQRLERLRSVRKRVELARKSRTH